MEKRKPFMSERKEAIACCLTLKDVYGDYPFHEAAKWNQHAIKLYLKNGFTIRKQERIR